MAAEWRDDDEIVRMTVELTGLCRSRIEKLAEGYGWPMVKVLDAAVDCFYAEYMRVERFHDTYTAQNKEMERLIRTFTAPEDICPKETATNVR